MNRRTGRGVTVGLAFTVLGVALVATLGASLVKHPPLSGSAPAAHRASTVHPSHFATSALQSGNGVVTLQFPSGAPAFTVGAVADSRIAATAVMNGLAEVNASSGVSAFAVFPGFGSNWSFATSNGSGTSIVTASAVVPVLLDRGAWDSADELEIGVGSPVGNVSVSLGFILNTTSGANLNSIRFTLGVRGWPWISSTDRLGADLELVGPSGTVLRAGPSGNAVIEAAPSTSTTVATFSWETGASVAYAGGTSSNCSVGTYQNISVDGSNSTVRWLFGGVAGNYSGLSYDPVIALNLAAFSAPALPAWLVTPPSIAVLVVGAVVVSALAAVAYRKRSRPTEAP